MKKIICLLIATVFLLGAVGCTENNSSGVGGTLSAIGGEEGGEESTMTFGNVMIFGDSYSTFEGFIPSGYPTYYSKDEDHSTGVKSHIDTWWWMLLDETNSKLMVNDSYSGSTIGYTGYNGFDASTSHSFIYRLENYIKDGFFDKNKIDTVFVFGGTNDDWSNAPLGEVKFDDITKQDCYFVLPAVSKFLQTLQATLPEARIVVLINTGLKTETTQGFKDICEHLEIEYVTFPDIEKIGDHPNLYGMRQIKNQIIQTLKDK